MRATVAVLCLAICAFAVANARPNEVFGVRGGKEINIEKRPYSVALVNSKDRIEGGGALINDHWVITAARNVYDYSRNCSNLHIRVGSKNGLLGGSLLDVEKIVLHPRWASWQNDIGLVKLAKPIKVSSKTKPISLATSLPKDGATTAFSGFGNTVFLPGTDGVLREAEVPFISSGKCKTHYTLKGQFSEQNFCASKDGVGPCPCKINNTRKAGFEKVACKSFTSVDVSRRQAKPPELISGETHNFDWGSPLVYNNKLIGTFDGSANDCGNPNFPAVFTDVTKFSKWIKETIKP